MSVATYSAGETSVKNRQPNEYKSMKQAKRALARKRSKSEYKWTPQGWVVRESGEAV